MPTITETVIRAQFPFWQAALRQPLPVLRAGTIVLTGCGTSYYLAQSLACAYSAAGQRALAVPGAEWARRPGDYVADKSDLLVIGLSRSGATTETIQAIETSRTRGWPSFAISCEPNSAILRAADRSLYVPTDGAEGIVMTVSACLMLLAGLRLVGITLPAGLVSAAQGGMAAMEAGVDALLPGRSHFVYLGGGARYGIATEGCLKLQEMSLSYSQAFHPMEYRHGPISLVGNKTLLVMLYSDSTATEEAAVVADVQAKGAKVIGVNGPGDLRIDVGGGVGAALAALPALQIMGERVALAKGINTESPRHLTKVVVLQP